MQGVGEVEAVIAQAHRVPAVDGYDLAATVFQPEEGARDWVIVSGAFAVAARFYARYATALAEAGFGAVTYDYRGIGASRPASLRGFPATITDWAVLDVCLEIIDTTRGPDIEATSGPAHIVLTDPDGNTIMVDLAPLRRPLLSRVRSPL